MFREDLRDLTRVQEIDQLVTLSRILLAQAGAMVNYSTLANEVCVSVDTIRRWMTLLESIYFSFRIRPWLWLFMTRVALRGRGSRGTSDGGHSFGGIDHRFVALDQLDPLPPLRAEPQDHAEREQGDVDQGPCPCHHDIHLPDHDDQ